MMRLRIEYVFTGQKLKSVKESPPKFKWFYESHSLGMVLEKGNGDQLTFTSVIIHSQGSVVDHVARLV